MRLPVKEAPASIETDEALHPPQRAEDARRGPRRSPGATTENTEQYSRAQQRRER